MYVYDHIDIVVAHSSLCRSGRDIYLLATIATVRECVKLICYKAVCLGKSIWPELCYIPYTRCIQRHLAYVSYARASSSEATLEGQFACQVDSPFLPQLTVPESD